MPPKSKSKNAPNQHDKRHESGLAPPGKRVTRRHSNGQLNGQPNGKAAQPVLPPALPSTGLNQGFRFSRNSDAADSTPPTAARDHAVEGTDRDRQYSDASVEEGASCGEMGDIQHEPASIAPAVEAQAPTSKHTTPSHACGPMSSISTIIKYYPLRDAISILILLLSLPSTLVLTIQALFASLTFVPPSPGISLTTLPNVKEMFNSPHFGTPAIFTVVLVDFLFLICWLFFWKPIQSLFLDLSQAAIAVSLSGAAASNGGPTYSIATCTVIVFAVHVLRYKAIHLTALDYLRSVIHKLDIGIDVPSFATSFVSSPPVERGWTFSILRTILGIHIVSQGVTTCIRRSLVKANEQSANVPAITKSDPEAAAGTEQTLPSGAGPVDGLQHPNGAASTDGRPPGPSPAQLDGRHRESNSKKKRKQANQVKSQQPLWAAIASTKVTFVKEAEQRNAADDAREAARMDTNSTSTTTNNTNTPNTNQIWIREVRDSEIFFSVELSPDAAIESIESMEEGTGVSGGLDKSRPFYVCINGAAWSSTRLRLSSSEDDSINIQGDRFDGEIFGLAPLSNYHCEIVGIASQDVLCTANIITQPAPSTEQAASTSGQPSQTLRPSSPLTMMKQSIVRDQAKLNDVRNKAKKTKKDQRAIHSDIKREITSLKTKLDSSGGSDDKQEKRLLQINQHKTQAEDAAAEVKEKIDGMGDIPRDEHSAADATRALWKSASDAKYAATREFDAVKAGSDRELDSLKSEISQSKAKNEKLAARRDQRTEELEKLISKRQADSTAKEKRGLERTQTLQQRDQEDSQFRSHIAAYDAETLTLQQKAHDAYQEIASLQQQLQPYSGYSSPPTPEGVMPGANGSLGSPQSNGFPPATAFHNGPFHSAQPSMSNAHAGPRGRSSSMLSQYSGFTDTGDEYSFSPEQPPRSQLSWPSHGHSSGGTAFMDDRKESEGSGSTGSDSPRPDAKIFLPGGKPSPIGPPSSLGKEKSPQSPVAANYGAIGDSR